LKQLAPIIPSKASFLYREKEEVIHRDSKLEPPIARIYASQPSGSSVEAGVTPTPQKEFANAEPMGYTAKSSQASGHVRRKESVQLVHHEIERNGLLTFRHWR
jgi:hypothetical protein